MQIIARGVTSFLIATIKIISSAIIRLILNNLVSNGFSEINSIIRKLIIYVYVHRELRSAHAVLETIGRKFAYIARGTANSRVSIIGITIKSDRGRIVRSRDVERG